MIGIIKILFNRILVIAVSAPVVLLDELLKVISRAVTKKALDERRKLK